MGSGTVGQGSQPRKLSFKQMQDSKAASKDINGANGTRGHSVKGTSPSTLLDHPSQFAGFYGNYPDPSSQFYPANANSANLKAAREIWDGGDSKARTSTVAITPTRYNSSLSPPQDHLASSLLSPIHTEQQALLGPDPSHPIGSKTATHFKRRKVVNGKTPIKNNKVVILSNVTWGSSSKISSALNEIVSEEAIVGFNFSSQGKSCRIQLATIEAALKVYEHFNNQEYDGKKVQAAYETSDPAKLP